MQGGGKFKDKYRIDSSRLKGYNYSQNGMYFVTICTEGHEEFFGKIIDEKMVLNGMGEVVQDELLQTQIIRKNVILDEWVIMPNHVHAIIVICNTVQNNNNIIVETPRWGVSVPNLTGVSNSIGISKLNTPNIDNKTADNTIKTPDIKTETPQFKTETPQRGVSTAGGGFKREWKAGCLGSIINQFKGRCTKIIQKSINKNFTWQTRFYDHIIKNEQSLFRIRDYIAYNPAKWQFDRNNQNDLWM